jgi:phosphatidylinositol alpha-1,6-mannosyltransferase
VFVHGEELTTTVRLRYQSRALRQVLRRADHVIAACSMARVEAEAIAGRPLPATVILPGVDLRRFNPSADVGPVVARYGLAGYAVLLTVGRLVEERKGHDMVLQAMPRILKYVPHALYVIAGEGERADTLRTTASRLGIEHAVRFLGRVSDADLPLLYAAAQIFVMPNRQLDNGDTEGFGMVFLEASASGTPVIGGTCGSTADSIVDGTTGFRVNPVDPLEIADRVIRLLTDPALASKMGRQGRDFAELGFDWATRAEQVWNITLQVASSRA